LQQQQLLLNTQRAAKLSTKNFFCSFFSNRLQFQSEILLTYLVILCTYRPMTVLSACRVLKLSALQCFCLTRYTSRLHCGSEFS